MNIYTVSKQGNKKSESKAAKRHQQSCKSNKHSHTAAFLKGFGTKDTLEDTTISQKLCQLEDTLGTICSKD
jgi:hypothetical protein